MRDKTPTPPELNAAPAPCVKAPTLTHVNVVLRGITVIETRTPAALVLSVKTVVNSIGTVFDGKIPCCGNLVCDERSRRCERDRQAEVLFAVDTNKD